MKLMIRKYGDPALRIKGKPVAEDFYQQLSRVGPGQTIALKVRSGRVGEREFKWKMGSRQQVSYQLKDLDQITPEQEARRAAWLKGESQPATGAAAP